MITVVGTVRAAAAGTGKAALYRRWSNKGDLVADAICHALPTPADVAVHGDVREDILALLKLLREAGCWASQPHCNWAPPRRTRIRRFSTT